MKEEDHPTMEQWREERLGRCRVVFLHVLSLPCLRTFSGPSLPEMKLAETFFPSIELQYSLCFLQISVHT